MGGSGNCPAIPGRNGKGNAINGRPSGRGPRRARPGTRPIQPIARSSETAVRPMFVPSCS